jgi:hypothetical protein
LRTDRLRSDQSSSLRLRLRLANATVQSAGLSDSYFWHSAISPISQLQPRAAPIVTGRPGSARYGKSGVGKERPCFRLSMETRFLHAGRKAGYEGVQTDFTASLALPRNVARFYC